MAIVVVAMLPFLHDPLKINKVDDPLPGTIIFSHAVCMSSDHQSNRFRSSYML